MSSGSYGWSGTNKRINVEVEVDGEVKKVQAQVRTSCCVICSEIDVFLLVSRSRSTSQ